MASTRAGWLSHPYIRIDTIRPPAKLADEASDQQRSSPSCRNKRCGSCRDIRWCRRLFWAVSRWIGGSRERVTAGFYAKEDDACRFYEQSPNIYHRSKYIHRLLREVQQPLPL